MSKKRKRPARPELTAKQQRFVEEYPVDFNASAAARRAGYSVKTAASIGYELLRKPEIQEAIRKQTEKLAKRAEITVDRVLAELGALAFSDQRKFFDEDGNLLPIHELDDETAAAIASFEVEELFDTRGREREQIGTLRKIKRFDKARPLELLGRYLQMWTDNPPPPPGTEVTEIKRTIARAAPKE